MNVQSPIESEDYSSKPESYFSNPRTDYVAALPRDPHAAVLEFGCGDGATGALALAEGKCGHYVGVELFEAMALRARSRLTEVVSGNVETIDLPWQPGTFDAFIASEVLEHLVDPGAVLKRIRPLLKPGARLYASSPCIAHHSMLRNIVQGRFDYEETGMMDRTHLRWFTPNSYAAMFADAGYVVDSVEPYNELSGKARLVRRLLGSRFDAIWFRQIDLRAHVPAS